MVLGLVIAGVIGTIFVTGDRARKEKMKNIATGIYDVTRDVAQDIAAKVGETIEKCTSEN